MSNMCKLEKIKNQNRLDSLKPNKDQLKKLNQGSKSKTDENRRMVNITSDIVTSLRGGGCGTSKFDRRVAQQQDEFEDGCQLPEFFLGDLVKYLKIIIDKASLASERQQKEGILIAIQWFTVMREHFNTLCIDSKSAASVFDLFFGSVPQLLKAAIIYLRISGYLCIQVLQITNDFCKVLFTFFMTNDKRFFKIQDKQNLDELISEFETQLEIESQEIWVGGAEFEITMIKAVIESSPSNSDEGQKLFASFLGGLVKSILIMSPTDELIDSLIGGAKFLHNEYQVQNLKKKYEVYYYFESLKWYMIQLIRQDVSSTRIISLLKNSFTNYIENSKDWLLNFCWVKMVAALISYRPIISKQELSINTQEQQQLWNLLIKLKIMTQLSINSRLGRLSLTQNIQNKEIKPLHSVIRKLRLNNYTIFSDQLFKSIVYSPTNLFSFRDKDHLVQIKTDYLFELLSENNSLQEPIEQLNNLVSRLEELFNKIKQDHKKWKTLEKDEKQKQLLQEDMQENTQNLINESFFIYSFGNNIRKMIMLFLKKLELIVNSITSDGGNEQTIQIKSSLQKSISDIQKFEKEKFQKSLGQLQEQKRLFIVSLVTLQISIEKEKFDEKIILEFQIITKVLNFIKQFNVACEMIFKKFQDIYQINQLYKKNQVKVFQVGENFQELALIISNTLCQNYFNSQITIIADIFEEASNKQGDCCTKLIDYYSLKYFVQDFVSQIQEQKDTIQEIMNFLKQNVTLQLIAQKPFSSKQFLITNNTQNINDMLIHQFKCLSQFFVQNEQKMNSNNTNDIISPEQILSTLKKDNEQLLEMLSNQGDSEDLQSACYVVAIVEQQFNQYLKNPLNPNLIQEFINQIYLQRNITLEKVNQPQQQQQNNIIQGQFKNQVEKCFFQLQNIIDAIQSSNFKCQGLLEAIGDKISLFEKLYQIEMRSNSQKGNNRIYTQNYEANDYLILKENYLVFLKEMQFNFQCNNPEKNYTITQSPESTEFLQILVYLCDILFPRQTIQTNRNQSLISSAKQFLKSKAEEIKEVFEDQNYKARQCYVFSLIFAQASSQELDSIKFCQDSLMQIWATEKDERVKSLLKKTEFIEMQKNLFSSDLKSFSKRLQLEMEQRLAKLSDLEHKIYLEGDSTIRQQMQEELHTEQIEFEDYLENINDMSSKLDIGIQFLKDIKRSLTQLKFKIDKLQDTVNNIGDDVRKLRGKNFIELLHIRKRKVLEQMQFSSLNQVYIPLKCQEWDPISGQQVGKASTLLRDSFQNQEGEINEFLQKDQSIKDVLLLRGVAGSGKSRAASKIEEFLWLKLDSKESDWIPIYVSLPTLKEPKFKLFDQGLESEFYQFDKIQIKEFKEALQQEKYKIILILDSYDEMKQDCIQSNLYHTNRFQTGLFKNLKEQLKIIITTRTEVLTSNSYQTQFYGDKIESLKEVQLLGFDHDQQQSYLEEYSMLLMKKEFLELYSFTKQMAKEKIVFEEFYIFWSKINDFLIKNPNKNDNLLLNDKQARQIIQLMKFEKIFQRINQDQIINLEKKILELWSPLKFQKLIIRSQIQHILTTPFIMEIVVQVLPSMAKKYSDPSSFKDSFINKYIAIKSETFQKQKLIQNYKNQMLALKGQLQLKNIEDNFSISDYKLRALKIWDQLQNEKFFEKFSLVDKITKTDLSTIDDASIVVRSLIVKKLTVFDFYMSFVEYYHQQQIKKNQELGRIINYESFIIDLFNFSQSLAIDLTIKELTQIKYTSKGQLTLKFLQSENIEEDDWLDAYFNDFNKNGDYKKLIRSCILLTQKGGNNSFTHKSIQEFYVGHYLLKFLDDLKVVDEFETEIQTIKWDNLMSKIKQKQEYTLLKKIEQFCYKINNSLLNQFNISTDNYKGVISLIKEEMKQKQLLKPLLLQIVKLSSLSNQLTRAASNSLYLLGYNNEFIGYQQFKNIKISDISLSGVSFYGSDFENSEFQNVSLSSCNFSKTNLTNANWTDIKCDELHSLIDNNSEIVNAIFSNDGQVLASASNGKIILWNVKDGKQLSILNFSTNEEFGLDFASCCSIDHLQFSMNDKMLAAKVSYEAESMYYVVYKAGFYILDSKSETKKVINFFEDQDSPNRWKSIVIVFSHDSEFIAFNFSSGTIKLLNFSEQQEYNIAAHTGQLSTLQFTEDDKQLISCSIGDCKVRVWNVQDRSLKSEIDFPELKLITRLSTKDFIFALFYDEQIKLWNILTNKFISNLVIQKKNVSDIKFLADKKTLVSWGQDNLIFIWNLDDGKQLRCIEKQSNSPICFSSDEKFLAIQYQNQIQLWDIQVGKIIQVIEGQQKHIRCLQFQSSNQVLASVSGNEGIVHLWDAQIQKMANHIDGHKKGVEFLEFSPDGQVICSWSKDETIRLWDVKEGKNQKSLQNIQNCLSLKFSSNGEFLLIYADQIMVWYHKEDRLIKLEEEGIKSNKSIESVAIQKKGSLMAWSCLQQGSFNTIILFDITLQQEVGVLNTKVEECMNSINFSPNELYLACLGKNQKFELWNLSTFQLIFDFQKVSQFIFSPDSKIVGIFNHQKKEVKLFTSEGTLITIIENIKQCLKFSFNSQVFAGMFETSLCLWNVKDGKQIKIINSNTAKNFKFSPDFKILAYCSSNQIELFNLDSLKPFMILEGKDITGFVFSQKNNILAQICSISIILWNYKDSEQIAILEKQKADIRDGLFSPDDSFLILFDFQLINLWDIRTRTNTRNFKISADQYRFPNLIAFSPNCEILAICNYRFINLWNLNNFEEKEECLLGHEAELEKIIFSYDGSFLLSQGKNETWVILWDVKNRKIINHFGMNAASPKNLLLSDNDKYIAYYSGDASIRLYETDFGKQLAILKDHLNIIKMIQFSPGSNFLASCSVDKTIILWDVNNLEQYAKLQEHTDTINNISFSPNNNILISDSSDSTIRIWDVKSKLQIKIIPAKLIQDDLNLSISYDGNQLAFAECESINIWNIQGEIQLILSYQTKKETLIKGFNSDGTILIFKYQYENFLNLLSIRSQQLDKIQENGKSLKKSQFSHDQNFLVIQYHNNDLIYYDLKNGKKLAFFKEHQNLINNFTFSPNGRILATCSIDGIIKLSNIPEISNQSSSLQTKVEIISSYLTLASYFPITASECQISGAVIQSKMGWNFKQLFLQKGAVESQQI